MTPIGALHSASKRKLFGDALEPALSSLVLFLKHVSLAVMEPCRYDVECWRPLCPFRHSGRARAARWAAVWALLAQHEQSAETVKLTPQVQVQDRSAERIQERTLEETADVHVPTEIVKLTTEEPTQNCAVERIVDKPVPQFRMEIGEMIQPMTSDCIDEQIVDIPISQILERSAEVITVIPKDRVQQRTGEQHIDVPVPLGEVIQLIPQARISDGIAEHIVNFPVPHILEQNVEVAKDFKERVQQRTKEQAVDMTVLSTRKETGEVVLPEDEQTVNVPGPQTQNTTNSELAGLMKTMDRQVRGHDRTRTRRSFR